MEMKYSREYVTLVRTGNFLRAAEELFMAQSTLSKRIQFLERDLGHKLFNRTSRTVTLTEFGRAYLPFAEEVVAVEERCWEMLRTYNTTTGQVTLGLNNNMLPYGVPAIIDHFRRDFSDNMDIVTADSDCLFSMLLEQTCDLAIIRESAHAELLNKSEQFDYTLLWTDNLVLVVSETHPLAKREQVGWQDLMGLPLLSMPERTLIYRQVFHECKLHGFEPHFVKTLNSRSAILDTVGAGYGASVFTKKSMAYSSCPNQKIIDIYPTSCIGVYLVSAKDHPLSQNAQVLRDYLLTHRSNTEPN